MSSTATPAAEAPRRGAGALLALLGPRSNARGVLANLLGTGVPAAVALLTLPRLAAALGPARFGVLALAWTVIGYLSFLHLGLGRAVARDTAAGAGADDAALPATVWTAALLTLLLGVVGGAAVFLGASWATRLIHVPPALRPEVAAALRLLALAVPFSAAAPVLSGVLEARRRFDLVNAVNLPAALVIYAGPLAVVSAGGGLVAVVGMLVLGRVLAWGALLLLCLRVVPALARRPRVDRALARPLLAFGGWTTVSAVVSPLLVYLDRFVVAGVLSTAAVAYYATAQEVVLRLGLASGAVVGVLFPAFAAAQGDGARVAALLRRGVDAVALLVLPVSLLVAAFGGDLLRLWMGAAYGAQARVVVVWLSVGLLINGLAKLPSCLLQGVGRPDLPALLHLLELPAFVPLLWLLVWRWGSEGAAIAWLLRVSADAAGLYWLAARRVPEARGVLPSAADVALTAVGGVAGLALLHGPLAWVAGAAAAVLALGWHARGALRPLSAPAPPVGRFTPRPVSPG